MTCFKTAAMVLGLSLCIAARAQMMQQPPRMLGEFKPVLGAGAQYEVTSKKGEKVAWAYAVVGKENVAGAEGYWLEMRLEGGAQEGMITKQLVVMRAGTPEIKRMILQAHGGPPMEMPVGMMKMGKRGLEGSGEAKDLGTKVATETVTVPAGTFVCDHYRTKAENATADVWISTQVAPYGMVKMTSAEMTMVLVKVLQNETSRISGQPQKMDLPMPGVPDEEAEQEQ